MKNPVEMILVDSEEEVNLASIYLSESILHVGFVENPAKNAHSVGVGTSSSNSLGKYILI